jgi:hypothetical protein
LPPKFATTHSTHHSSATELGQLKSRRSRRSIANRQPIVEVRAWIATHLAGRIGHTEKSPTSTAAASARRHSLQGIAVGVIHDADNEIARLVCPQDELLIPLS